MPASRLEQSACGRCGTRRILRQQCFAGTTTVQWTCVENDRILRQRPRFLLRVAKYSAQSSPAMITQLVCSQCDASSERSANSRNKSPSSPNVRRFNRLDRGWPFGSTNLPHADGPPNRSRPKLFANKTHVRGAQCGPARLMQSQVGPSVTN